MRYSLTLGALTLLGCGAAARQPGPPPPVASVPAAPAPAPGVGAAAPPVSVEAIDGSTMSLGRGKVTILVFWATWSQPDRQELVALQEIYSRVGAATLAVMAVSID